MTGSNPQGNKQYMPISCHFTDCKALLFLNVSPAVLLTFEKRYIT